MTNITNSKVIVDIVVWFCWWPPEKPWAYQADSHSVKSNQAGHSMRLKWMCETCSNLGQGIQTHILVEGGLEQYLRSTASTQFMTNMTSHDDVIKWKHFPHYWPFVRGIHQSLVNSPHKRQWRGDLMFSLICARINGWVNNREAGDLRCHVVHYDITVMIFQFALEFSNTKCWCITFWFRLQNWLGLGYCYVLQSLSLRARFISYLLAQRGFITSLNLNQR